MGATATPTRLSEAIEAIEGDRITTDAELSAFLDRARAIVAAYPIEPSGDIASAAVMLRMSKDTARTSAGVARDDATNGQAWGVKRQLVMGVRTAENLRWGIGEIYCDNSITASRDAKGRRKKARPEYDRLLEDIAAGDVHAVIMQDQDRLQRDRADYIAFEQLCRVSNCRYLVGTSGAPTDLHDMDGQIMATIKAAFAEKDSRLKAKKLREKYEQRARMGEPNMGGTRAYGWEADKVTMIPEEADFIRKGTRRSLAGESWRSIAQWLTESGATTVTGARWRSATVKQILTSPRNAGLCAYQGEIVRAATWDAIITPQDREKLLAKIEGNKHSNTRAPQRYVLAARLRCGRCESRLYSKIKYVKGKDNRLKSVRRYVCKSGPDYDGCGRLTVVAEPVENLLANAVLDRLDSVELADAVAGKVEADTSLAELSRQVDEDKAELEQLAHMKKARRITMAEWLILRDGIESRLDGNRRKIAQATETSEIAELIGRGEALRKEWPDLSIDRRQSIIKAVLEHAVILPGKSGARSLDVDRVDPAWRY
ncbi:recombinase family protein [Nocardia altamirensis]|uniref:recombinase family protein n=1 Tax=Nocardia altamirensis TaxID=472158 RepID=UPI000A0117BD|nr:recombinase family protein [Nocardia altamirensis]